MSDSIDKPYVVISGAAAFSWGRYATQKEAEDRAEYVRTNEPTVFVAKKVGP